MDNIKLNRINNFQLTNNEKQELKGGEAGVCGCGCCYANNGGSSVGDNCTANWKGNLWSKDCAAKCWGINVD